MNEEAKVIAVLATGAFFVSAFHKFGNAVGSVAGEVLFIAIEQVREVTSRYQNKKWRIHDKKMEKAGL